MPWVNGRSRQITWGYAAMFQFEGNAMTFPILLTVVEFLLAGQVPYEFIVIPEVGRDGQVYVPGFHAGKLGI